MKTWPSTGRTLPPWTRSGPGAAWTTSWSWEKRMRKSWRKTEQWILGWAGCVVGIRAFLLSQAVFLLLTVPCCRLSLLPKREPSSPFQCAHSSNKHRGRFRYQSSRLQSSAAAYLCYSTHADIQMCTCVFQLPSGDFIFWCRTVKILICTKAMLCINCYFSVCWSLMCCRPTRFESLKERLHLMQLHICLECIFCFFFFLTSNI